MTWKTIAETLKRNSKGIAQLCGMAVSYDNLSDIAYRINAMLNLPLSGESVGATYQSIQHLVCQTTDRVLVRETVRKICANKEYICKGRPIPLWDGSPVQTTVGMCGVLTSTKNGKKILTLTYRALSGLPAGMLFTLNAPSWWAQRVLTRKCGLWKLRQKVRAEDISGCIFDCTLYAGGIKGEVAIKDIKTNALEKETNYELVEKRYGERPCKASFPCRLCPRTREQCRLAVL